MSLFIRVILAAFILLAPLAAHADCTGPAGPEGSFAYNSGTYQFCDGTNWIDFSTDGMLGSCTQAGDLGYDTTEVAYKFCDGADWQKVACVASNPYPVVEGRTASVTGSPGNSASHVVSLPSGIQSGELLIIALTTGNVTPNTPSGWTHLFTVGTTPKLSAYYRIANGSEGSTVTVTTSSAVSPSGHNSYRISGYQGVPQIATATPGGTPPDPPSLAPSWGNDNALWLAIAGTQTVYNSPAGHGVSAYPASYSDGITAQGFTQIQPFPNPMWVHLRTSSARRELQAASENPGTFTMSLNAAWVAATVAIRGSGGGGGNCSTLGACAVAGMVDYFPAENALAYCDGADWQIMAQ